MKDSFQEIFESINRILIVLGHPDDMEINCGGLLTRLIDNGKQVRLVVTTNGGKGVKDKQGISEIEFAEQRIEEQKKAGSILGIKDSENFNLDIPDGELETSLDNIEKIVFHIRQFQPDVIITHNPEDFIIEFFSDSHWLNHRDHRNTAIITLDACYPFAQNVNFFKHHFKNENFKPHKVQKILIADSYQKESLKYFEITKYLDKKAMALEQHLSAFSKDDVPGYLEENKFENGYFESLAYYEIY